MLPQKVNTRGKRKALNNGGLIPYLTPKSGASAGLWRLPLRSSRFHPHPTPELGAILQSLLIQRLWAVLLSHERMAFSIIPG